MQKQIDGSITTHFYAYAPTLSNIPASQWTTNELKNVHLGDLFYNTSVGYCYRFVLNDSTYSWSRISDSDVTKALNDSASALTKATSAESKAIAAQNKVTELEQKLNSLTFTTNVETGDLEWGFS